MTVSDKAFADLTMRVEALEAALASASGKFVTDHELDGPKGDPNVRMDPSDWRGARCKGHPMSECHPEFLDIYARTLEYFADNPKPDKEKYARYDRLDAARARSWAKRIRSGWTPPARPAAGAFPGDPPAARSDGFEAPSFNAPSFGATDAEFEEDIPF